MKVMLNIFIVWLGYLRTIKVVIEEVHIKAIDIVLRVVHIVVKITVSLMLTISLGCSSSTIDTTIAITIAIDTLHSYLDLSSKLIVFEIYYFHIKPLFLMACLQNQNSL